MLERWPLVQQDLHDLYGIDTGDTQLMTSRSWRWLQVRVMGLLNSPARPTRLAIALRRPPDRGGLDDA